MWRWLPLALVACGKDEPDPCATGPTWDNFAEGYVATWCLPCHSEAVVGDARQGAPDVVNFDEWSQVLAFRSLILTQAVYAVRGDAGYEATSPMPPLGGVPLEDIDLFEQWLECGAQGQNDPPTACDTLASAPATTLASQADADAFCAEYNAAASLTVSGAVTVDCLCDVAGDLAVTGGDVVLPTLVSVGGDLTVSGGTTALRAPALEQVGGGLVADGVAGLAELAVPELVSVGGGLTLRGLDALGAASFDQLRTVGGALEVVDDAALVTVDLPRLLSTGSDLVLQDLPSLTELLGTSAVDTVGGSIVLRRLPSLVALDSWHFKYLYVVGQDVVVADNPALFAVDAFMLIEEVPGSVLFEQNDALTKMDGFDNLVHVGGDVVFRDNPAQQHLLGMENLETVDGTVLLQDLFAANALNGLNELVSVGALQLTQVGEVTLGDFTELQTVAGDLTITGCQKMTSITGLPALTSVGGALTIEGNDVLATVTGFGALTTVGGAVAVTDNPLWPTASITDWLATVAAGGPVTISGNG